MKRGAVIDVPDCVSEAAAGAILAHLGVDVSRLRVDVFRDATSLGARVRVVDVAGDVAPYLPEIGEDGMIVVLRPGQLSARAYGVVGAADPENVARV